MTMRVDVGEEFLLVVEMFSGMDKVLIASTSPDQLFYNDAAELLEIKEIFAPHNWSIFQ